MNDVEIKYPCLFDVADEKSLYYQRLYNRLYKFTIYLLVISSIISSYDFDIDEINLFSSIFLIVSLTLSIILLVAKPEKGWYEGRAIAESIKSLSWKFVTKTEPYGENLNLKEAEEKLVKNFKSIIGQKKDFFLLVGSDFAKFEQITDYMRQLRQKNMDDRLSAYKKQRLDKQKNWYFNKSKQNKKKKITYFILIFIFQFFAISSLVINYFNSISITLTPIFVCIATSLIAWLQVKRFQELSQSYATTATELSMIKTKVHHIKNEKDLSDFVDNTEYAISREHTLWLARRDSIELFE